MAERRPPQQTHAASVDEDKPRLNLVDDAASADFEYKRIQACKNNGYMRE